MKVIFLDVDGVLNSARDGYSLQLENDYHFEMLKKIVDATDAKIVLSSSWRIGFHAPSLPEKNLIERLEKYGMEIMDFTPCMTGTRGDEIREWLSNNGPVESFVILDDGCDMAEFKETNLVRTNTSVGLQEKDVDKAIKILKGE